MVRGTQDVMGVIPGSKLAATASYSEEEILMPKSAQPGQVPGIVGIEIQHPNLFKLADKYSKWHLSIHEEDAISDISDQNVVAAGERRGAQNTAVGEAIEDPVERVYFPYPIPVSQAKLYLGFIQDTGSSHTYNYRLLWTTTYVPGAIQRENIGSNVQF